MKFVAGILLIRKLTKHIYNSRIIFPYWMKQLQPIYVNDVFRMVLIRYLQQQDFFPSCMKQMRNICNSRNIFHRLCSKNSIAS